MVKSRTDVVYILGFIAAILTGITSYAGQIPAFLLPYQLWLTFGAFVVGIALAYLKQSPSGNSSFGYWAGLLVALATGIVSYTGELPAALAAHKDLIAFIAFIVSTAFAYQLRSPHEETDTVKPSNISRLGAVLLIAALASGLSACSLFHKPADVTPDVTQQQLKNLNLAAERLKDAGIVTQQALRMETALAQAGRVAPDTDTAIRRGVVEVARSVRIALEAMADLTTNGADRQKAVNAAIVALDHLIQQDVVKITDPAAKEAFVAMIEVLRPILVAVLGYI